MLAVQESSTYTSERLNLRKGDIILLYTDGVTEARGVLRPMYVEGLENLLADCPRSAQVMVDRVLNEVKRRSGDRLADDIAIVALEVT